MFGDPKKRNHTYFVDHCDYYVAWPIHSPKIPEYGEYAFVELKFGLSGQITDVHFIRQLEQHEINSIRRQYMVWGNMISGHGWALLIGYPSTFGIDGAYDVVSESTNGRSVGV